ncbi:MAG: hypothetical protein F6K31_18950 [Symploca sp. SIO2G7]|nr:hypothetical protein [Symploca sp. SIO2G7]
MVSAQNLGSQIVCLVPTGAGLVYWLVNFLDGWRTRPYRLAIPHSPFPIPHSPFPIPNSPFPIPHSPFPILNS